MAWSIFHWKFSLFQFLLTHTLDYIIYTKTVDFKFLTQTKTPHSYLIFPNNSNGKFEGFKL